MNSNEQKYVYHFLVLVYDRLCVVYRDTYMSDKRFEYISVNFVVVIRA